jgi:hypothetical protein
MLGSYQKDLSDELTREAQCLNNATKHYFGVTASMFRTVKFLFYILTLLFSGYLIEMASVDPFVAMTFAALLITGPEGLEAYLVRQGVIAAPSDNQSDDE